MGRWTLTRSGFLPLNDNPDDAANRFEFELAERLGRTVGELRAGMSNREFVMWQGYDRAVRVLEAEREKGVSG